MMKAIFKAEKKITLVELVIEQIRSAISSGKLTGGERLVETDIADTMQINRTAVREAFRSLEKEGLVTITPFKGAHVTLHTKEEIRQMFEVMSGLEGMCTRLAIQKMTKKNLQQLDTLHADLEKYYTANEPEKYLKTNWIFHKVIQNIAANEILDKMVNELKQKISLYRKKQLYQPNRFEASIIEHRLILETFHANDPNLGEIRMREHLSLQGESLM